MITQWQIANLITADVISNFVDGVQIDISDGEFARSTTWPYTEGEEEPNHTLPYKDSLDLEMEFES